MMHESSSNGNGIRESLAIRREMKQAVKVLSRRFNGQLRFQTLEEKQVLRAHITEAQKRTFFGGVLGSMAGGIGWRLVFGQRHLIPAAIGGTLMGMTYGMFSVRQHLFMDMMSLPDETSPFAARARRVLAEEMPNSLLLQQIQDRLKEQKKALNSNQWWDQFTQDDPQLQQEPLNCRREIPVAPRVQPGEEELSAEAKWGFLPSPNPFEPIVDQPPTEEADRFAEPQEKPSQDRYA